MPANPAQRPGPLIVVIDEAHLLLGALSGSGKSPVPASLVAARAWARPVTNTNKES